MLGLANLHRVHFFMPHSSYMYSLDSIYHYDQLLTKLLRYAASPKRYANSYSIQCLSTSALPSPKRRIIPRVPSGRSGYSTCMRTQLSSQSLSTK